MQAHDLADAAALQNYFNRRLCAMLTGMGKQVVAWDEVLHPNMPELLVQNWRGATTRDRALAAGRDCLVSAGYYLDLFYPAETYYQFDPQARQQDLLAYEDGMRRDMRFEHIAGGLAWTDQWRNEAIDLDSYRGDHGRVLGGEACLWSELVDADTLEVRLWSRLPAVAERLWSPAEINDVEDFYRRLRLVLELPPYAVAAVQQSRLRDLGLSDGQISTAAYLEPVKWYARLLGAEALQARLQGSEMPQARPYDTNTRLNRLVDFISPESLAARQLMMLEPPQLLALARRWRNLDDQDWPPDVRDAIAGLRDVGAVLVELLGEAPQGVHEARYAQSIARLQDLYQPRGEYMVAVVPWLLRWLATWYGGER
jgi:hexosaminidase